MSTKKFDPMEAALRQVEASARRSSEAKPWEQLVWRIAEALKCLPSSFVDENDHILKKAKALQAQADSLASAGGVEVVAYLVSGGRIFKDQAVIHEGSALTRIAERKDGTVAHPLVKKSDHLAALSKEREVADGLARALKDAKVATQEAERLLHKAWAEHGLRVIDDGDGNAVDVAKAADRMDSAIDVIIAALTAHRESRSSK